MHHTQCLKAPMRAVLLGMAGALLLAAPAAAQQTSGLRPTVIGRWPALPGASRREPLEVLLSDKALSLVDDETPHVCFVLEGGGKTELKLLQQQATGIAASASWLLAKAPLDRGFPPAGEAYETVDDFRHALWRWLPLQGIDLLVFVRIADDPAAPARVFAHPTSIKQLGSWLEPLDVSADESAPKSLWACSGAHELAGVGAIPALRVEAGEKTAWVAQLLSRPLPPSAARQACLRRLRRSPEEVAAQLAPHYGQPLQLHYIPALATVSRLRREAATTGDASQTSGPELARVLAWAKQPHAAPKNGSEVAGRLLLAELTRLVPEGEQEPLRKELTATAELGFESDGTPKQAMPFHAEMSDAVFMSTPLLAEAGRVTGDERYFAACLRHVKFMQQLCWRADGLYRHHPGNEAAWGRGNGFPALGLAWTLSAMPASHSAHELLKVSLTRHLRTLIQYQDRDGCWRQIIDRPDAYRELTATCMILFACRRAVDRGWIPEQEFDAAIQRGWRAVRLRVGESGNLIDVCTGTGKQKQFDEYYLRRAILGPDPRGGAMAFLVSTEMAGWGKAP
ncbi:MAG: glycoside hydrolase family 88 protein [Planctomycetales bacterium]|nr:glycoside hydrolase family 88 protein [Planctomycetales bacterium]